MGCLGLTMELALRSWGGTRNRGSCFSAQLLGCAGGQGEKYIRKLIKICNKLQEENFS